MKKELRISQDALVAIQTFLNAHDNKDELVIGLSFSLAIDSSSELAHAINSRSDPNVLENLAASSLQKAKPNWQLSVSGYKRAKVGEGELVEINGMQMYLPTDIREFCAEKILDFKVGKFVFSD